MTLIGNAIRAERKKHGLTLQDIADRIGVSCVFVSDIERYRTPNVARLIEIANEFPEVDTAEWLWLLLEDKWGAPVADMMRRYAARTATP